MSLMRAGLVASLVLLPGTAWAHVSHASGLAAGFVHPFSGADHVLAMVAVGLWAATRGGRAVVIWPLSFVGAMIVGFVAGLSGLVVPGLEPMILSTVIVLGAVLALGMNAPIAGGAGVVAVAGALHGLAHGMETGSSPALFAAGFTLATALLHMAGIGIGFLLWRIAAVPLIRLAGLGIVAGGLALTLP